MTVGHWPRGIDPKICACGRAARKLWQEDTVLRDAIQRFSLSDHKLGYRPITVLLKREGWVVNHNWVERIRWSDNLLCLTCCHCRRQAGAMAGYFRPHGPVSKASKAASAASTVGAT